MPHEICVATDKACLIAAFAVNSEAIETDPAFAIQSTLRHTDHLTNGSVLFLEKKEKNQKKEETLTEQANAVTGLQAR